jgi:hypothetical protein
MYADVDVAAHVKVDVDVDVAAHPDLGGGVAV